MKRPQLPELTEQQARSLTAAVAFVIAAALARLIWGSDVVLIVYGGFLLWLLADRVSLHERMEGVSETADRALGPIAPEPADEPWKDAPPVPLPPLVPLVSSGPPRPHPFPPRNTVVEPAPPPVKEAPDAWLARIEAEHQAAMDRIAAIGHHEETR